MLVLIDLLVSHVAENWLLDHIVVSSHLRILQLTSLQVVLIDQKDRTIGEDVGVGH